MKTPSEKTSLVQSDVHFCMVAPAVESNLSPILDRQLNCKKVVLIHSDRNLLIAKCLEAAYRRYQVKTEFYRISCDFDTEILRQEISELMLKYQEERPLVNLSSGTKPMSIVLYEMAMTLEFPIYYLNGDDSLSWFWPKRQPRLFLEDRIKLSAFLLAHGLQIKSLCEPKVGKVKRHLLEGLVKNIHYFQKAIPQLNFLASSAKDRLVSVPIKNPDISFYDLIEYFETLDVLRLENNKLIFTNEEARFFANGGWLEVFLFDQIRQIGAQIRPIQDNLTSVELISHNGVMNEIDNLVLCNNGLFVIECKTAKYKQTHRETKVVDAIYKLETLVRELGGQSARGMLVSVFPVSKADARRAKQYNIKIVELADLKNIRSILMQESVQNSVSA